MNSFPTLYKHFKTSEFFEYNSEYEIEIITTDSYFEAWIQGTNYGIKSLLFGCPKEQQTYEEFIKMAFEDAKDNGIKIYQEEYEDGN